MTKRRRTQRGRLFSDDPRSEVQDELEFHLEQRVQEFMAQGMDEASARRAALDRLGDLDSVRGECATLLVSERRALARRNWLSDAAQDLRFAVRSGMRAPMFALMAVITLALGIGANAAVFGVVKSVLLDALPYAEPTRLVRVQALFETSDLTGALSAGTVHDVIDRQRSFSDVAASISNGPEAVLQVGDRPVMVPRAWVQPDFFRTLGVSPAMGRAFDDADAEPDTAQVAMISHEVWRDHMGRDPDVLGRSVVINGISRVVIGVLPANYVHPTGNAQIFMPFSLPPLLANPVNARGSHFLELVGRLNPGVALAAAEQEVAGIGRALVEEYPQDNRGISLTAESLHETMMGDTRTPLLVLMGSAGLVLLVACANLAAALLSRTIARRKEFAVRISLGAPRSRLVRQLLAESVLLATVGGLVGLLVAAGGLSLLRGVAIDAIPDYANLSLDAGAIVFTFTLALLTGVVFGLTPALSAGREEPQTVLRDESRGSSESRGAGRLRGVLVAGQVALCLSLLAGAGLLTRSLWLMTSTPLGFEADNALTFTVPLSGERYATAESHQLFRDEMLQRIGALPGVAAVTMTSLLPTRVDNSNGVVDVDAELVPGAPVPFIPTTNVTETYFETLGMDVVAGRSFTSRDDGNSPPVAMVSETMAKRFWPEGNAVGARIRVGPDPEAPPMEVIGIVRDARTDLTQLQPDPMLYTPIRQGWWGSTFIVRADGDPRGIINPVRGELQAYDSALPMASVETLRDVVGAGLAARRLPMLLMLSFGALALLLACVGIYALFANMAVSREREFGVRMALGSSRSDVAALVLREGALWMGVGLLAGAVGVFAVSRALQSLVYGIAPLDAISIAAAVATLLVAAAVALAIPVHRATRADPVSVMR